MKKRSQEQTRKRVKKSKAKREWNLSTYNWSALFGTYSTFLQIIGALDFLSYWQYKEVIVLKSKKDYIKKENFLLK